MKSAVYLLIFLCPMIYVMANGILFTIGPAGTYLRSAGCIDIQFCECLWSSLGARDWNTCTSRAIAVTESRAFASQQIGQFLWCLRVVANK